MNPVFNIKSSSLLAVWPWKRSLFDYKLLDFYYFNVFTNSEWSGCWFWRFSASTIEQQLYNLITDLKVYHSFWLNIYWYIDYVILNLNELIWIMNHKVLPFVLPFLSILLYRRWRILIHHLNVVKTIFIGKYQLNLIYTDLNWYITYYSVYCI